MEEPEKIRKGLNQRLFFYDKKVLPCCGWWVFFFTFKVLVGPSSLIKILVQKSLGDNLYQTVLVDV